MKTVFMFSGQGAQYAGMGKDLYENYAVAKEVFDRAEEVLGYSIKDICFSDEEKLGLTEFTQPAILTMSIAAMKVLQENGINADMTAGLSLGEYSALVASGAMKFEEAVALVQKRGKFMSEAVPAGKGGMFAIIGLDTALVEKACEEAVKEVGGVAVPANYNAPGQIVIGGDAATVEKAGEIAKEKGAKLAVKLALLIAILSDYIIPDSSVQPAADKLLPELEKMNIGKMEIPVYTNVTAEVLKSESDIVPTLAKQVVSPVRWEHIIRNMYDAGADTFIELGPGKTLCGFVKRTVKGIVNVNVEDTVSLEKALLKIKKA